MYMVYCYRYNTVGATLYSGSGMVYMQAYVTLLRALYGDL